MLKLGLFLLMLYALPDAHSVLTNEQILHNLWRVAAPVRVQATRRSCLVVPCTYTFPQTYRTIKTYRGLWRKNGVNVAVSRANSFVHRDYAGRTRFLGPVQLKNCTWMLWRVRPSDAGKYYFRVLLPEYYNYQWSYRPTEVQVIEPAPPDLKLTASQDRAGMSALCCVHHSCPKHLPAFSWSHSGTVVTWSHQVDDWQWMTYSKLSFHPEQDTVEIRCTVTYFGGEARHSTVSFGPHVRP